MEARGAIAQFIAYFYHLNSKVISKAILTVNDYKKFVVFLHSFSNRMIAIETD